jgi:hypothetical protein
MNYPTASYSMAEARRQRKNLLGASSTVSIRGSMSNAWCRTYGHCFFSVPVSGIKPILSWIS